MKFEWKLRDEILVITHYWPWPILAFLVGCLVGWIFSLIIPSHYRASVMLSVAYNADTAYRNPDDYKNWQLEQLDALAFASDITQETLLRLQEMDPYWKRVSIDEFSTTLNTLWRTTGLWRFAADGNTSEHARQAARIWTNVFLEKYQDAYQAANRLVTLESKLGSLTLSQAEARQRLSDLKSVRNALLSYQEHFAQDSSGAAPDQATQIRLWSLASYAAGYDPAWQDLLASFPSTQSDLQQYQQWIGQALIFIETQIEAAKMTIADLESEIKTITKSYQQESKDSRGLSSTIYVSPAANTSPEVSSLRPTSLFVLVGGILGLMVWGLIWLGYRRPGLRE